MAGWCQSHIDRAMVRERARNISKALTNVLRYDAEQVGLQKRSDGYARVRDVLALKRLQAIHVTDDEVREVVATSDKGRFQLETVNGVLRIRAVQGHSMQLVQAVELMTPLHPDDLRLPPTVVHATYLRLVEVILQEGLKAGGEQGHPRRTHVRFAPSAWSMTLGADLVTVGSVVSNTDMYFAALRQDCEIAVWVNLPVAVRGGVPFFEAENGEFCKSRN